VHVRTPLWQELSQKLAADGPLWKLPPAEISRTAALYRAVSTDLMRARTLGCTRDVIAYLDALTAQAHNALYAASRGDRRLRFVFTMTMAQRDRALLEALRTTRAFGAMLVGRT